jgi:hypothetical protein
LFVIRARFPIGLPQNKFVSLEMDLVT